MFRSASVMVAVVALTLFLPSTGAAQLTELVSGKKFEGEMGEKNTTGALVLNPRSSSGSDPTPYGLKFFVTLKARQSITIFATGDGKGRKLALTVWDPTMKLRELSPSYGVKAAQLTAEEVAANGKYTIAVGSDEIGTFTVKVVVHSDDEAGRKQLEDTIKQLEKELEEAKKLLKGLSAKPSEKP